MRKNYGVWRIQIIGSLSLKRVAELQNRTVSAILVWVTIVLLMLNGYLRSPWIVLIGIAIVIVALIVYFNPRLRK